VAGDILGRPREPLVGRAVDLAALAGRFSADERLLTVTGPGGAGKTRLAVELAHRLLAGGARSGAWICDLAGAADPEAIGDAVASALGVHGSADQDPVTRLGRAIAARGEALLVLDDLDHAVDHAEATVGRWLELAPEAWFLVTSRQRLGIAGEGVHELGPLGLPDRSAPAASEAVELFVRCACRLRGSYALTEAEAPFVAEIVRELDGMPLAIELAAARTAVMAPRALLHRLRSRFEILRRSGKRGPERHATLEAAIDGSWSALTAWERDALAQASVFAGGFSVEAAEAVIDLRAHPGAPPVLDVLAALRDRSMLHASPPRPPAGELRLGMYASIRAYAARSLDAEAARAAEARHAAHFVAAAEALAARGDGREGPEARARILADRENLLAVIERVLGRGPVSARTAEPALRALLVLAPALEHDGPLESYVRLLDPVLDATRDSGADPGLLAHALAVRGRFRRLRGQERAGARDLVHALAMARTTGARRLEARVTHDLGHALAARGDLAGARDHFERAAAMHREAGERTEAGRALAGLGALAAREGRPGEAAALLERALAAHEAEQSPGAQATDRRLLGEVHLDAGRLGEARAHLEASRDLSRSIGDRRAEALAIGLLARVDHASGDRAAARAGYERAEAGLAELGFELAAAVFIGHRGVLSRDEGRAAEAYTLLSAAVDRLGADGAAAPFLALRAALDAAAPAAPPPPDDALLVGPAALWFRPPRGDRASLDRRRPLALLLQRLAAERRDRPGAPLGWDALLAAAWPGERVLPEAGAHRVRVALSTLRKLGLRDVLRTTDDGYLLDPAVPAVVLD
jgi:predicted ATPase/Tfp pilus assembly protein PilF